MRIAGPRRLLCTLLSRRMPSGTRHGEAMPEGEGAMYTYCLFCDTAKCHFVASIAEKAFPCRAIYPRTVQHRWIKRKPVDEEHPLTPGYVFLYSDEQLTVRRVYAIQGVIKCLRDQDRRYELSGSDEAFALMLLENGGVIGKTQVYQEGQMICLRDGVYKGVQTRILKVDHRNMRMQIAIPFAGMQVKTWVEYEVVEPVDQDGDENAINRNAQAQENQGA